MLKVYGDIRSGNCYKVKLLLSLLGLRHGWEHVDVLKHESRTPAFLAKNPSGQIPLLEFGTGQYLPESNAILHYLADGSPLLPADRLTRAKVMQWMFFEQYNHEPFIAGARFIVQYLGRPATHEAKLQEKMEPGREALAVMERHLSSQPFFAGGRLTIADIALYAYTHVAHEGGFDLSPFPALRAWLERVRGQPGYLGMDCDPTQGLGSGHSAQAGGGADEAGGAAGVEGPPLLRQVDHVHVYVADRAAAVEWYRRVLGLRPVEQPASWAEDGGPLVIADPAGAVHLALFERPPAPCRSTVALAVGAPDFHAWRTHLGAALGQVVEAVDHQLSWSLYFTDPDGNPYEITSYDYAAIAAGLAG